MQSQFFLPSFLLFLPLPFLLSFFFSPLVLLSSLLTPLLQTKPDTPIFLSHQYTHSSILNLDQPKLTGKQQQ